MEIPSQQNSLLIKALAAPLDLSRLRTGQTINIQVVEPLAHKNEAILRLGKQLFIASTKLHLTTGETLKVSVEKSNNYILLTLPKPAETTNVTNSTLLQLLPKQAPIHQYQQALLSLASTLNKETLNITPNINALKRLTTSVLQSLPAGKSLASASTLKTAVNHSGIFLESRLSNLVSRPIGPAKSNISQNTSALKAINNTTMPFMTTLPTGSGSIDPIDLKANLISIIHLLKNWPKSRQVASSFNPTKLPIETLNSTTKLIDRPLTPPLTTGHQLNALTKADPNQRLEGKIKDVLTKAEGALSKLTINQLVSSTSENTSPRQSWQIEIPFFNGQTADSLFLLIEREKPSNKTEKAPPKWTVSLEMNPGNLGFIKSKLTLQENRVSSQFWTEKKNTRQLIQQHLTLLKRNLNRINIQADELHVSQGPGPELQKIKPNNKIFSEKA